MSQRMQGKVAVVTGAGSGMGRAIATRFGAEGAAVAVVDVAAEGADETVRIIRDAGGRAASFLADVSDADSVAAAVTAVLAEFGEVTTLVNNAGIFDGNAGLEETDEALWDRVLRIDLKGVFLLTKALMPALVASGSGSIVNMSSIAGTVARGGGLAYTAAKSGVLGLTRSIAAEYGPAVRCNAVLPGAVLTSMTKDLFTGGEGLGSAFEGVPAGRFAQPEELANAVLFVASDEASFMYGSAVTVDGGWTAI